MEAGGRGVDEQKGVCLHEVGDEDIHTQAHHSVGSNLLLFLLCFLFPLVILFLTSSPDCWPLVSGLFLSVCDYFLS